MTERLRIGTRGSPLAVFQAEAVGAGLMQAHPGLAVEYVVIRTSGDRIQDRRLAEIGGKGLFCKEIEEALLDDAIDVAVHSMKDVETELPPNLSIAAILPREDPRDAFLSPTAGNLGELPPGARVGTSSVRRQAQILHRRPDLAIVPFRGNVETRLRKLEAGEADATLLAMAGLNRLGKADAASSVIAADELVPAAGQGAIGIEIREANDRVRELLDPINDANSETCVAAERAMLAALDGSCRTPIGALAEWDKAGATVTLQGLAARPDGTALHRLSDTAPGTDAAALGTEIGRALRAAMGEDFFT